VSRLFPHHIGAKQSGMHGSQVGWYAIDGEGDIAARPYSSPRPMPKEHGDLEHAQSPSGPHSTPWVYSRVSSQVTGRIALSCPAPSLPKTCLMGPKCADACHAGHRNGCELETTGQYDEDHEAAKLRRPYSFQRASRSASLSPKKARPPATTRPIQLTHIGTDQPPIMSQSI
jgi:hypothetical protein